MTQICQLCRSNAVEQRGASHDSVVPGDVCTACSRRFRKTSRPSDIKTLVDGADVPLLVIQADPRLVYTANSRSLELFGKDLHHIEQHRGGQVFDCVHAFTDAGCGKDEHCASCGIKNAIVETLAKGSSSKGVSAMLLVRKSGALSTYRVQISTQKIGDMALVRLDAYEPAACPMNERRMQ